MTRLLFVLLFATAGLQVQGQSYFPNFSVQPYCDEGTPFWRAIWVRNTTTAAIVIDVDADMNAYTASGNEIPGWCYRDSSVGTERYFVTTTTGTIPSGLASYSILNTGAASATVTYAGTALTINGVSIPGGAQPIQPGQAIQCSTFDDQQARMRRCAGLDYDATGTTLRIIVQP